MPHRSLATFRSKVPLHTSQSCDKNPAVDLKLSKCMHDDDDDDAADYCDIAQVFFFSL